MRGWTFPIGRFFGVDVRIHSFFVLLLMLCLSYANLVGVSLGRGFGLGAFLLLSVFLREVARLIVGAWFSLKPVTLMLLPTGGLSMYASQDADEPMPGLRGSHDGEAEAAKSPKELQEDRAQRAVALSGPLTNLAFGFALAGVILTVSPQVDLVGTPWVNPTHLLRALVWVNLLLGAVNLLPAWPLDGGRIFQGVGVNTGKQILPTSVGIGPIIAVALILGGMVMPNMWLLTIGIFMLIAAQLEDQGRAVEGTANTLTMRDVMMEDYTMLSASATLEDAMRHATHTLQDVFPVVRGGNLVGAVSRQHIAEALRAGGNSYVQGIMTRSFRTAQPGDPLMKTLRRIMAGPGVQGAQLVPVIETVSEGMAGERLGERIVGIITPQILQRSMSLLDQSRRIRREADLSKEKDER